MTTHRRKGSVLLPFIGIGYFFPLFFFLVSFARYSGGVGSAAAEHPLWTTLIVLVGACPAYFLYVALLVTLGMTIEIEEHHARVCGLAGAQFWTGKDRREKLAREAMRFTLLLVSAILPLFLAMKLPDDPQLRAWGFGTFWQFSLLLTFALVFAPLKKRWPRLGGFEGEPDAVYNHRW